MEIFQPRVNASLSATTTSSSTALAAPAEGGQIRVAVGNVSGAAWIYIKFGETGLTATSSDIAMLPNTVEVFTVGRGVTHVAAITNAGTADVKISSGLGV